MPAIIQQILQGNFSAPLTLVFIFFTLLAFYFLFRIGFSFFVRGDEYVESAQGKRQTKNDVRLLIISVLIALFTGFVFTYFLTTVIGAFFRGPSQLLGWPWAHPNGYNPIDDLL